MNEINSRRVATLPFCNNANNYNEMTTPPPPYANFPSHSYSLHNLKKGKASSNLSPEIQSEKESILLSSSSSSSSLSDISIPPLPSMKKKVYASASKKKALTKNRGKLKDKKNQL